MKKNTLFSAVLFFSTVAAAGLALAQPAPEATPTPKNSDTPAARLTRKQLIERLQLTKEQKQELRKNRASYRKTIAELEGKLKVVQVDLENEMDKPDTDQEKLDQIAEQIGSLQGQKVSEKIKAEFEVEKKILTPQQDELLKTLQGKESNASGEIL